MFTKLNVVCAVLILLGIAVDVAGAVAFVDPAARLTAFIAGGLVVAIAIAGRLLGDWLRAWLASFAVLALAAAVYGIAAGDPLVAAAGLLGGTLVGVTAALALQMSEIATASQHAPRDGHDESVDLLRQIHEHTILSDTAKRVLYRDRELELLRRVIEDDIHRSDYNAALRLCDDMANVFGYREEAEAFRSRIESSRHERYEAQVHAALEELDGHLQHRDWRSAHEIAARIRRLFPEAHVSQVVENRINRARDEHKNELEIAFRDAAEREDFELAMERLRQLDRYMSPEEAEELSELAQTVVSKHRDNLGMQFKLAVSDRRWSDAARVGDAITAEFPNTKMAEEVRSMIDVIRTRATQTAVAGRA